MGTALNTFQQYIELTRENQPELDKAWKRLKPDRYEYRLFRERLLGKHIFFYAAGANTMFLLDLGEREALELLVKKGWGIKKQSRPGPTFARYYRGGEDHTSEFYYMLTNDRGHHIQFYSHPGEFKVYFNVENEARYCARQTDAVIFKQPQIHRPGRFCPITKKPKTYLTCQTVVSMHPRIGTTCTDAELRSQERSMENFVMDMMQELIERKIPALFESKSSNRSCVVNLVDTH